MSLTFWRGVGVGDEIMSLPCSAIVARSRCWRTRLKPGVLWRWVFGTAFPIFRLAWQSGGPRFVCAAAFLVYRRYQRYLARGCAGAQGFTVLPAHSPKSNARGERILPVATERGTARRGVRVTKGSGRVFRLSWATGGWWKVGEPKKLIDDCDFLLRFIPFSSWFKFSRTPRHAAQQHKTRGFDLVSAN